MQVMYSSFLSIISIHVIADAGYSSVILDYNTVNRGRQKRGGGGWDGGDASPPVKNL